MENAYTENQSSQPDTHPTDELPEPQYTRHEVGFVELGSDAGILVETRPEGAFLQLYLSDDRALVYSEPGEVPTGGLDEYLEKVGWLSEEELRSLWAERGFELLGSGGRCPANHVLPPRSELLRISRGSS